MRRLALACLPLIALAVPATAAALATGTSTTDGTLVVQNGAAPRGLAVIKLGVVGTAIGHVSTGSPDQLDTVVIYDQNNTNNVAAAAANGAYLTKTTPGDQKTKLVGSDFRFRAADGAYTIWIYGSGVDVFAVGAGKVTLQGLPDSSTDGRYSLDGGPWHSLPAVPSDLLTFPIGG
ncbi:MAG: hypothetical protein KGL94_00120 [Acidobacteriota bacterium]|nr:hypothetical protein [Acidobacteriota bacterium]